MKIVSKPLKPKTKWPKSGVSGTSQSLVHCASNCDANIAAAQSSSIQRLCVGVPREAQDVTPFVLCSCFTPWTVKECQKGFSDREVLICDDVTSTCYHAIYGI